MAVPKALICLIFLFMISKAGSYFKLLFFFFSKTTLLSVASSLLYVARANYRPQASMHGFHLLFHFLLQYMVWTQHVNRTKILTFCMVWVLQCIIKPYCLDGSILTHTCCSYDRLTSKHTIEVAHYKLQHCLRIDINNMMYKLIYYDVLTLFQIISYSIYFRLDMI